MNGSQRYLPVTTILLLITSVAVGYLASRARRQAANDPAAIAAALEQRLLEKTIAVEIRLPKQYTARKVPVSGGKPFLQHLRLDRAMPSDGWSATLCLEVDFILDEEQPLDSFKVVRAYAYTGRTWYFHDIGTVVFANSRFYDACRDYAMLMEGNRAAPSAAMGLPDVLSPDTIVQLQADLDGRDKVRAQVAEDLLRKHDAAIEAFMLEKAQ